MANSTFLDIVTPEKTIQISISTPAKNTFECEGIFSTRNLSPATTCHLKIFDLYVFVI